MSPTNGKLPSATSSKVVVATTVALSFISFWRGASIVLSDLASSAFYAGGAAEQAIGKAAPWFVIGVMLFSFAVRSIYLESCSMYVRGGVYVVVHDSMGPVMAKLSVSALTISIPGVSATTSLRRIGELTARGYVDRVPDARDGRRDFVALTLKAHELLKDYLADVDRYLSDIHSSGPAAPSAT